MAIREKTPGERGRPTVSEARIDDGERIYAIGDIHGEASLLAELLKFISEDNASRPVARTTLVLLGDLIDRGPGSVALFNFFARMHRDGLIVLKGNHESLLVDSYRGNVNALRAWMRMGGRATLAGAGITGIDLMGQPDDLVIARLRSALDADKIEWLNRLPISWECGNYLFVHAGIRPLVPLDWQSPRDLIWIREPFLSSTSYHERVIVHGHTINPEVPELYGNRIGLDTGGHEHGRLTALRIEKNQQHLLQTAKCNVIFENIDVKEDENFSRRLIAEPRPGSYVFDETMRDIARHIDEILTNREDGVQLGLKPRSSPKLASDYNLFTRTAKRPHFLYRQNSIVKIASLAAAVFAGFLLAAHEQTWRERTLLSRHSGGHLEPAIQTAFTSDTSSDHSQDALLAFEMGTSADPVKQQSAPRQDDKTRDDRDHPVSRAKNIKGPDDKLTSDHPSQQLADRREDVPTRRLGVERMDFTRRNGTANEHVEPRGLHSDSGAQLSSAKPSNRSESEQLLSQTTRENKADKPNDESKGSTTPSVSGPAVHLTGSELTQALVADHVATAKLNENEIHRVGGQ